MKHVILFATLALACAGAQAASGKLKIDVDSPGFVSGSRVIEFENGVPQTIVFSQPSAEKFDPRCSVLGLVSASGEVPTKVALIIAATKFDGGTIEVQTKLLASKAGPTREQLVSVKGDKARCPSIRGEETVITSSVGKAGTEILRATSFDNLELAVKLTAQ
ncbi:hypothetical protein [Cupriavidus sp. IK-TO18]|uniref:hypothetical protein n=1 Tax=Cupriavidus sp. IK-TO18 TaxID=2782182 RepID=UPI00189889D3|nr:hypothetical protein [Cupriavidus sp. IK-TO18]MBF6989422.1 hypothetical protein [Cupriavidus sp. IK-TO18]